MRRMFRGLTAAGLVAAVALFTTLHVVGYREAIARVEDYVTSFQPGVPGAFEPYGLNRLMRTTRVRYNNDSYQLSFSSTGASVDEVIEAYAAYLPGPDLVEATADGHEKTLYHSDGISLTAIRAIPVGPNESGTVVQKVFAMRNLQRPGARADLSQLGDLAPILADLQDQSRNGEDGRKAAREGFKALLADAARLSKQRSVPREDVPGFDLSDVPRYPSAVRVASMALEDGRIQIVSYHTDASADMVAQFYRAEAPADGWDVDPVTAKASEGLATVAHLTFYRNEVSLNVIATPEETGGGCAVTVMLQ